MIPFQPNYLNLEYFFNLVYRWLVDAEALVVPPEIIYWAKIILFSIGVLAAVAIVILSIEIINLRRDELRSFLELLRTNEGDRAVGNQRWEKILAYLETDNESDWKQAVLEADKLLEEVVAAMPYPGDNLGERLKNVEPSDFLSLESAWEAHRIRNKIAHESGYTLTRREARRAIELYEKVFKEFNFI